MPPILPDKITFVIKGQHVPSFKNRKSAIIDRKTRKPRTISNPENKERMQTITRDFVSQFACAMQTLEGGTLTAKSLQSLTVSLLPLDDSRQWIPELHVSTENVDRGNEGAEVTIERI